MATSTTKLGKLLHTWGFVAEPFTTDDLKLRRVKGVSNETYGRDSRVYVHTGSAERRLDLERRLHREGVKFHPRYSPGSGSVEVSVSYFKGDRHWE